MALTDPPDAHISDHPELLRLAALLLRDPPAIPHVTHEVTPRTLGVAANGPAEALLAQLIFHAPDGPDAHPDTLVREALAFGLTRLAETVQVLDRVRTKADMFKRRCERYEAWFALPPDQRHPLGPEFTPPSSVASAQPKNGPDPRRSALTPDGLRSLWAKIEANADAMKRTVVETAAAMAPSLKVLLSLRTGELVVRDPRTGEMLPVDLQPVVGGEVESGPVTPSRTVHSAADLAAWLREDGGPDDPARAVLGEGGIREANDD